ncbi:hypothetical protein CSUI_009820 [Cystoisospora suis]|uniref:Uncharacterized protein n=1 Tax=Cystoisospora suis TaxID=483139 RepID=A0A2C6KJ25_9APIC|nr:hypothetical protein CSUI_009820 [Cystoisospora suis]
MKKVKQKEEERQKRLLLSKQEEQGREEREKDSEGIPHQAEEKKIEYSLKKEKMIMRDKLENGETSMKDRTVVEA